MCRQSVWPLFNFLFLASEVSIAPCPHLATKVSSQPLLSRFAMEWLACVWTLEQILEKSHHKINSYHYFTMNIRHNGSFANVWLVVMYWYQKPLNCNLPSIYVYTPIHCILNSHVLFIQCTDTSSSMYQWNCNIDISAILPNEAYKCSTDWKSIANSCVILYMLTNISQDITSYRYAKRLRFLSFHIVRNQIQVHNTSVKAMHTSMT